MGLRDILTGRHQVKGPAPDRLFAITTAYVDLQAEHQIAPAGSAAIVFQALSSSEFESTLKDMEEVVTATGGDSGTTVSSEDDSYGYRWMILRSPAGRAQRRRPRRRHQRGIRARSRPPASASGCCAPCSRFTDATETAHLLHLQLQARLLVPVRSRPPAQREQRSTERELQLKAQIGSEMPLEPELERWFPLWGIPI